MFDLSSCLGQNHAFSARILHGWCSVLLRVSYLETHSVICPHWRCWLLSFCVKTSCKNPASPQNFPWVWRLLIILVWQSLQDVAKLWFPSSTTLFTFPVGPWYSTISKTSLFSPVYLSICQRYTFLPHPPPIMYNSLLYLVLVLKLSQIWLVRASLT